ncbi:hypothetical protein ACSBR2_014402 [Camellia fascicularis]
MDPTPKLKTLGGSLKVTSVQELAKEPHTTVPPRYVRPQSDRAHLPVTISVDNTTYLPEVPVISMQRLLCGDNLVNSSELEKLHHSCRDWGFFLLIDHGVSCSLVEKVKLEIQDFFNLPIEEKDKLWQQPEDIEGFGQAFVRSEEQKLDWADLFYMVTLPSHLRKPHLFPKLSLPLCYVWFRNLEKNLEKKREKVDCIEAYSAELKNLAMKLVEFMAKALNMKGEEMRELFEEGMQSMRVNYYPPCPQPELIKKDGMWIPIKPLPNAFIVNIGDMLQTVTNGIYKSIDHRATVNSEKERLSIATFLGANLELDMGPAPSLITPQTPAIFRRVNVTDYFKAFLARELRGKSCIDVTTIQNEEDDVQTNSQLSTT